MSEQRWWGVCSVMVLTLALAGCGGQSTEETEPVSAGVEEGGTVVAELTPKSGSEVTGQAAFEMGAEDQVTLYLSLQNLPPGVHAAHIHEIGDCSADDGTSAGGHWNPLTHDHGKWNEAPFHLGDLGNVEADEFGNGSLTLTTSLWTMATGMEDDIVGKAIIVHAGEDDFTSQPTGAAGGRIACGVIVSN